jgi:hypothetical protein
MAARRHGELFEKKSWVYPQITQITQITRINWHLAIFFFGFAGEALICACRTSLFSEQARSYTLVVQSGFAATKTDPRKHTNYTKITRTTGVTPLGETVCN